MGLTASSSSSVEAENAPSAVEHKTDDSLHNSSFENNESGVHTPEQQQAEGGIEDSLDFPSHKHTRTMGLEALLMFPKLALTEMFLPVDAVDTPELPCGPRIAAERVRMLRSDDDSNNAPLSLHATYYKQLFLRDRLQTAAALKATSDASAASCLHAEEAGFMSDERLEEQFDFLSLPSLAAMDAGMCLRPSWNELAPHVGTVQSIKKLLKQMRQELQQIKAKLSESEVHASSSLHHHSPTTCSAAKRGRGDNSRGGGGGESDGFSDPEPHEVVSDERSEISGVSTERRRGRATTTTSSGNHRDAQSVIVSPTDALSDELPFEDQGLERRLSLFLRGRGRRAAERAQHEAEAVELEKDISVLTRACLELEALLRRVWNAERLAEDACIEKTSFRQLWCHPLDDLKQRETADRLFSLCLANNKRQLATSRETETANNDGVIERKERTDSVLSFTDLLDQLPPKALECLWCSAELRRKERQNYRYFWI